MLSQEMADSVVQLRRQGKTYREIQKLTRICRATIAEIISGRWQKWADRRHARRRGEGREVCPKATCPGCRRKDVPRPCPKCLAEIKLADSLAHGRRVDDNVVEQPTLDLHGPCRLRYEAIHEEKMRRGELPFSSRRRQEEGRKKP